MYPMAITLRGIEQYWNEHDNRSLFDDIALPEGIDKDVLVPFIIVRGGDFPVSIPDPDFIHNMTLTWFRAYLNNFSRMLLALSEDYNPLHNYDRHEEEVHDNYTAKVGTDTSSGSNSTSTGSQGRHDITNENKVAAFNSSSYENREKMSDNGTDSNVTTGTSSGSATATTNQNGRDNGNRALHAYGNIGVTTSMDMLRQEIAGRKEMNIYEIISDMYVAEFCIPVY